MAGALVLKKTVVRRDGAEFMRVVIDWAEKAAHGLRRWVIFPPVIAVDPISHSKYLPIRPLSTASKSEPAQTKPLVSAIARKLDFQLSAEKTKARLRFNVELAPAGKARGLGGKNQNTC